jgi:hypothetical protein
VVHGFQAARIYLHWYHPIEIHDLLSLYVPALLRPSIVASFPIFIVFTPSEPVTLSQRSLVRTASTHPTVRQTHQHHIQGSPFRSRCPSPGIGELDSLFAVDVLHLVLMNSIH